MDCLLRAGTELLGDVRVAGRGLVELAGPLVRGERGWPGNVGPVPAAGDDDARCLKFPVGPGHGPGRQREVGGELPDRREAIPASGQTIRVEGMNFYRLKDGRVTDIWTQFDGAAMMQQHGAIPA